MKNFNKPLLALALLGMFAPATVSLAEDTDIYAANNGAANNPNVLVIIDNSANWASASQHWPGGIKQGQAELNALRTVISELGTDINLGLMMFTPGSGSNEDGGYVRFHVRQMDATNKSAFQEMLGNPAGCTDGANSLNSTPNCIYQNFSAPSEKVGTAKTDYSATMFEAFKYFGGYTCPAHATDDIAACSTGAADSSSGYGPMRYAGDPETRSDAAAYSSVKVTPLIPRVAPPAYTYYVPPVNNDNSCAKNYVVFIGNGYPSQDSAAALLTGVGGNATQVSVPDFTTISGVSQTLLGSGAYANQSACETAASAAHGAAYDSYTCSNPVTSTTTTSLGTSACGQYASQASCEAAGSTDHPGYSSYACTVAASCAGAQSLGTSSCGQYASVAACEAGAATAFPGYASYGCVLNAAASAACTASTTTLTTTTCGQYATAGACQTAAAISYPGYASYACTSAGACTTNLGATNCYASASACQTTVLAANPGYGSVACGSATNCTAVLATTCDDASEYNTAARCNAGAPAVLGGTYATYSCDAGANCDGGKTWTITGRNQSYTATGTGTRWTVTGTNPAGQRYDMTGTGGGSTYTITGSNTSTSWSIYGNKNVTTAVPTGTYTGTSSNYADEWAKFLYQTDVNSAVGQQNIRTYTIDVFKDAQDADETKLLMSMAAQGGGKYFSASNEDAIKNALRKIFSEIQSVNSVFASSSLPVSVNTQGTYLNQVFIGMFRPDGGAKPRWAGNLKQYQFAINPATSALFLADKNNDNALSATTGFITPCADSMWTSDSGSTYWNFGGSNAKGSCGAQFSAFPAAGSSSMYSDAPDGDVVEKGGAAQRLRGALSSGGVLTANSQRYAVCAGADTPATANCRKLLTCDNTTCSATPTLLEFSTANAGAASSNTSLTTASLGAADDGERDLLINWVRGQDVDDENSNTVTTEVRPSVHGAVVHSQPAVVDYGGATGVYAFYGSDDGVFHAIDGGKTDAEGIEAWGFIAPETYGRLKRSRSNDPLVNFPRVLDPAAQSKSYFFDGSVSVYQKSGATWIYATMRRGGRAIYAFDVSTPTSPTLKWRKGCFTNSTTNDSNCSAGWSGIGQTWSKPQIGYLSGYVDGSGNPKPVLFFGGGYDTCEDTDSQVRCAATPRKGANIWFVDADTGAILRTYPTNYSVAGEVTLSKDSTGYVTYVHAVDTGGYLYRINVKSTNAAGTTFTSWSDNSAATDIDIANLSEANHARKFLFGPEVVRFSTYSAVLVGTGDREHPMLNSYACGTFSAVPGSFVTNQFFMVKDTPDTYPVTLITPTNLTDVTNDLTGATAIGANGWRISLRACEQVVNKALSISGLVYFGTNQPINAAVTACSSNLGTARGYAVNIQNGASNCAGCARSVTYLGGGLPPTSIAGTVSIDGVSAKFIIGGAKSTAETSLAGASGSLDATSEGTCAAGTTCGAIDAGKIEFNPTGPRKRMFWYIQKD